MDDLFQKREQILNVGNFLVGYQDIRLVIDDFHFGGVRHHISGDVAAVELHAFDDLEFRAHGLGFFDGDHAVVGNGFHGIGDFHADGVIIG